MSQPSNAADRATPPVESEAAFHRRLANRVHDQLQQLLPAARMKAGLVRLQLAPDSPAVEGIRTVERLLEQAMEESTGLIQELKNRSPDRDT